MQSVYRFTLMSQFNDDRMPNLTRDRSSRHTLQKRKEQELQAQAAVGTAQILNPTTSVILVSPQRLSLCDPCQAKTDSPGTRIRRLWRIFAKVSGTPPKYINTGLIGVEVKRIQGRLKQVQDSCFLVSFYLCLACSPDHGSLLLRLDYLLFFVSVHTTFAINALLARNLKELQFARGSVAKKWHLSSPISRPVYGAKSIFQAQTVGVVDQYTAIPTYRARVPAGVAQ